jgi:hypothetical protein
MPGEPVEERRRDLRPQPTKFRRFKQITFRETFATVVCDIRSSPGVCARFARQSAEHGAPVGQEILHALFD